VQKILILVVPVISSICMITIYHTMHVGFGRVMIPAWYKEKRFEPAPVHDFIVYWTNKSFIYGLSTFIITLAIMLVGHYRTNKASSEVN
jgi:hypothetical protein